MGRHDGRAYPDLSQGPADLQSAALTTELYVYVPMLVNLRCWVIFHSARGHFMVPRFGPQGRSAFQGFVGKRFGVVCVGLGSLWGLSLAAHTNSAERVEAMEAYVPRFPTGVLDGEIGAHLTHAAVETRISISVFFHAELCMVLCTSTISEKECSY